MSDLRLWPLKGVWQVRGTVKIPGRKTGVRVRESTGTGKLRDAEAYRDRLRQEVIDRETIGPGHSLTFAGCVIIYLSNGGEKRFIGPILERFGTTRVADLTADKVVAFANERYGHLSPASVVRFYYTPLNAALRAGCKAHELPPKSFATPAIERQAITAAPPGWFRDFFQVSHPRIAVMVLFLTTTGRRVSEACRLTVEDCLFDHQRGPRVLIRKTKGGRPIVVPITPVMVWSMQELMRQDNVSKPDDTVFGYSGRWSVNQAIERVCVAAGLKYYSSHKLGRHAFASRFLEAGGDVKRLKDAGGWATLQIVDEAYGHLAESYTDGEVLDMASAVSEHVSDKLLTYGSNGQNRKGKEAPKRPRIKGASLVGTRGIEPLTPTMSREVSTVLAAHENQENKGNEADFDTDKSHELAVNRQETKKDV